MKKRREKFLKKNKRVMEPYSKIMQLEAAILSNPAILTIPPQLAAIPIVILVLSEIFLYADKKIVDKRMQLFKEKVIKREVSLEELSLKISEMNEHQQFVLRNNLKFLCLSALPDTVDLFIKLLIDYIVTEEQELPEELCEIVRQFNANDIKLLNKVTEYLLVGTRTNHKEAIKKSEEKQEGRWKDRNVVYGENTIFWSDFCQHYNIHIDYAGRMLNQVPTDEEENKMHWGYMMRSLLKLETLGILELEYIPTLGTVNKNNVDRIHVTLFGQELLKYFRN